MKFTAALISALLLLPGHALAASGYDTCVQEEKTLLAQEKERCSGLSYILNPSGCFAAQKALREQQGGKCRDIIREGEIKAAPIPPFAPPIVPTPAQTTPAPARTTDAAEKPGGGTEQECSRLKTENVRLRAEIERLRAEIEQLGKRQK